MKRFVYNDSNSIWHIDVHIKSVLLVVDPRCTSRSLIHPSSESHDVQCGPQRKSVSGSREQGIHPALSHPCTCYQSFAHPLSSSGQESRHSCPEADLIPQPLSYVPGPALPFTHHCLCAVLPPSRVGSEYVFTVFYIVRCFFQTVLESFRSYHS